MHRGTIAYNPKDLEPWGFIDPVVTSTSPEDTPKGYASIFWPNGTFITSWGLELPKAWFVFNAVEEDVRIGNTGPTATTYILILTFVYYDIDGVEVEKRTRTVRFIVNFTYGVPEEDLPQNSLNTYYLFPELGSRSRVEFEVVGTLQLAPGSELASRIVGLQYEDFPVFGRNNIRLLPSDRLGLSFEWSSAIPMPTPQSTPGMQVGIFNIGGGPSTFGVGHSYKKHKWVFQIVNAKTIVDRKITITQSMIDTPRILGGIPIQIVGDEEGITRVLCAKDEPLDLNATELETLGIDFPEAIYPGDPGDEGNRIVIDRYRDGALWNKNLKQTYRSDFVAEEAGSVNQARKFQSVLHNSEYDLMANTILINPNNDDGDIIEAGHEIYVTYGHVYDFMLRQDVEVKQVFVAIYILGVPSNFSIVASWVDVHNYLPQNFWAAIEQTDRYIYDDINMENREEVDFNGIIVIDPNRTFLPESNWTKYIEDQEALKLAEDNGTPSAQVPVNLVKVFEQRQVNSMRQAHLWSLVTDHASLPNGIIIGSYSYDGGKPGGILWMNILNYNEVRVLIPRDQIRDQDWFYNWFVDGVRSKRFNEGGGPPEDLHIGSSLTGSNLNLMIGDLFFDQNIFVNSFVDDNNKLAYESYTAEAINDCSKFDPSDDTGTTGIGFANLDFFEPGTINSRIDGLPGIDSEYYSDASSSIFITPPRQSAEPKVWDPITIDSIPGVYGAQGSANFEAQYSYFQPVNLDLRGRVYIEKMPSNSTTPRIWTRHIVSSANNATTNYGRTRGIYSTPDSEGMHSRLFTTDRSILDDVYSTHIVGSEFSHMVFVQEVSYRLYVYREDSSAEMNYTKGIRVVPAPKSRTIDLKKDLTKSGSSFELILPGYAERIILYYDIEKSDIKDTFLYLSIFGDSSDVEYIDISNLPSDGYIDIYLGYLNGQVLISSNNIDSISSLSASVHWISDSEAERLSSTCSSCSPIIDSVGNYNIFELIPETVKTNLSVLRSGSGSGPYFTFPYLFLTFGTEEISNMVVRSDYRSTSAYVFFTIDGSLLVKKVIFSDLDSSQAANIDLTFLDNGIDGNAFINTGFGGIEGQLLSYNYFLELFNNCDQAARLYFEPAYLIQSNISDNLWIGNELISSSTHAAYKGGGVAFSGYDFSNLSDDDEYTSRIVTSDGIIKAYLEEDNEYFNKFGYTIPVESSFTAEVLSNGSVIVLYIYEGKIYGRLKSEDKDWLPLFHIDNETLGYMPIRTYKLSSQEVGLPDSTDMNDIGISDIEDSDLDADLSFESMRVNFISSCYDPKSDNLYLFYIMNGFSAFHKIRGTSISRDLGISMFYKLDTSSPRALLSSRDEDYPIFLAGEVSDELDNGISIRGNNYLQFKYPIESIPDFQGDKMQIQESPVSSFVLSDGKVRFMYVDSNEYLRGGVISGSHPQLDVQLRKNA